MQYLLNLFGEIFIPLQGQALGGDGSSTNATRFPLESEPADPALWPHRLFPQMEQMLLRQDQVPPLSHMQPYVVHVQASWDI